MSLKRLPIQFDAKAVAEDGCFKGYASTFGNVDRGRDVVLPGAFKQTLADKPLGRIKMLRDHDSTMPIGVWTSLAEDKSGLVAEGQLAINTTKGRETYELMKMGALDSLSIGYQTLEDETDRGTGVRRIKAVDLWEISVVTFPMNPAATISTVKAEDMTERDFERLLTQDAGFTRSQARLIISHGFKALKSTRDAAESDDQAEAFMADAFSRALAALRTTHP